MITEKILKSVIKLLPRKEFETRVETTFDVRAVVVLRHPAEWCFVIRVQDETMEIYVEGDGEAGWSDDFRVSLADPKAFQKTVKFIVEQSRKNCTAVATHLHNLDISLMKWQKWRKYI